jgi:hypothetical protein
MFMRLLNTLCVLLLLSGLAAAQATVIGGTASNWVPAYGVYAAPFVPLVVTPSVTLAPVSPSAAGASNATFGNVAGATNATLSSSFVASPPVGVYSQPVWYGPSTTPETAGEPAYEPRHGQKARMLDVGVASWESSQSVTYAMAGASAGKKAARTYTNQDVDHVNDSNGTVKYRGKTEHI